MLMLVSVQNIHDFLYHQVGAYADADIPSGQFRFAMSQFDAYSDADLRLQLF